MKYAYLLFASTLILTGCGPARKDFSGNKNPAFEQLITPEFEKLDTSAFEIMHKKAIPYEDSVRRYGKYFHSYNPHTGIDFRSEGERYFFISQNDTVLLFHTFSEDLGIPGSQYKFSKSITKTTDALTSRETINQNFTIFKIFYPNGNIEDKGINSWLGFSIGKEYFFDEKGKLIKVIDHDEGYNFTFEDVVLFCKKNNILVEKNNEGANTSIGKRKYKGKTSWMINSPDLRTFVIDGKTGILKYIGTRPMPLE